jgi:hypothetical protein
MHEFEKILAVRPRIKTDASAGDAADRASR